jgi:hypothetical protein
MEAQGLAPALKALIFVGGNGLAVFAVSSINHVVLPHHKKDYQPLGEAEDKVLSALNAANVKPGNYAVPFCASGPSDKAWIKKVDTGVCATLRVDQPFKLTRHMHKTLIKSFVWNCVVSAYVLMATALMQPSETGAVAAAAVLTLAAYGGGAGFNILWEAKAVRGQMMDLIDAIGYAIVTALCYSAIF